jgi:TonB-linked SusC/RagA family outer membrane protein
MRKLTTLLVLLLFAGLQVAFAQRTITGRVTKTTDGTPLPGVTVVVKGTTTGNITDADGKYTIQVPNDRAVLLFTFIGFTPKEVTVGAQTALTVTLDEATLEISEVVVTALGIKKESKALGYSATSVPTAELTTHKSANMMSSLEGRVAGMLVTIPASGIGGSTQIRLRGQAAFNGASNSPLIVINGLPMDQGARGAEGGNQRDLGDNMSNINPDDIESMTVLKGATAAALYGSRAANGAIIITTKSGSKNQGIGVEFSSSYTVQKPLSYFEFQDAYGQGTANTKPTTQALAAGNANLSFGGRLDGTDITLFDGTVVPYSFQPNRVLDYFQNGTIGINTVAFTGGNQAGSFRASFSNMNGTGIEPTNEYKKKTFNLGVNYDIAKNLKFTTNINYTNESYINPPQIGQQGAGSMNFLTRMAMNIPLANLRDHSMNLTPGSAYGTETVTSGFQGTLLNPYYATLAGQSYLNSRDRFLGTSTLRWNLTSWLYAQGRFNYDYNINSTESKSPGGIGTSIPTNSDGTYKGSYNTGTGKGININADFLVGASKKFNKFSVDASFGGNTYRVKSESYNISATNLTVRDFFSVSNGVTKTPTYGFSQSRTNSLYGLAEFAYNSMFYLNFTGRTDWFSVLNPESNSKFYPSVSGSFIFSELLKGQKWLNYAKLRGSWAQVGSANGVGVYEGLLTYGIGTNQFNGQTTASIANGSAPNPNLQPYTVTEQEVGLEARILNNKLHFDIAYFHKVTTDQVMNVQISDASGYGSSKRNLGSLLNSGLETLIEYTPVESRNFSWTTAWNNTYLYTEVLSVGVNADGTPIPDLMVIRYNDTGNEFLGELHYTVGMAMNQLYTRTYLRNENNDIVLTSAGMLKATTNWVPVGSSIPKFTGGWNNTFNYKNLSLGVFIDYKFGGTVLSSTYLNMTRQGMSVLSLEGRRVFPDGTVEAGLVFPGVYDANPDPAINDWQPNKTAVTFLQGFYADYRNLQIGDPFTFKSDYVKLRNVSLSYNLTSALQKVSFLKFVKGLSLTASCRNVAVLYKDIPNLDPEAIQSSGDSRSGYENSSLLTTRDFMFSLNVKF